jgi:predicted MFS family arabinose efflux permease
VATREARSLSNAPLVPSRRWYTKVLTDLGPAKRSPAYRRLLIGQVISASGTQLTVVALPVQIFALTGSSFSVGLLGLVSFVPLLIGGLYGGAIADSMDRRKLAMITSTGLAVATALLVLQAVLNLRSVGVLYALAAVEALLAGIDSPARQAIIPRLVPVKDLPAAGALSYAGSTLATTVGPLVAGLLIAGPGLGVTYSIDTLSFLAAFISVLRLPAMPPEGGGRKASTASVFEGLKFLRHQPVVTMTFAVDLVAMIFGMPRALFPALAIHRFGGDAATVGFLYAALAAGGFIGTIFGGWFGKVRRQGLAVLVAVAAWGATVVGFGLLHALIPALIVLAASGAADSISAVFRGVILQTATPDAMRGRLQGVFVVVVAGGPRLGDLESGAAASFLSLSGAVVSGGIAVLVGVAVLAAAVPGFRRYKPVLNAPDPGPD